ncbi:MAG TPA: hypothetical protein VHD32_12405 [Candidatus Didemnitutus sp.]|nr:hypothetical protein [Candidatus Didemnitutus sp.]
MTRSATLRRLHFLNALFAPLTGHDLYLAQQIDAAITTSLNDALGGLVDGAEAEPSDPKFVAAAAELFGRLCAARPSHGFFHWDAAEGNAGSAPLFARAGLMEGLKRVAAYPESTVLVTNLRSAHCPPRRRWTARRDRDYQDTLALLNDLAAARTRRGANLNLLFL